MILNTGDQDVMVHAIKALHTRLWGVAVMVLALVTGRRGHGPRHTRLRVVMVLAAGRSGHGPRHTRLRGVVVMVLAASNEPVEDRTDCANEQPA